MTDLERLARVLDTRENEVAIPEDIRARAELALRRRVDFAARR